MCYIATRTKKTMCSKRRDAYEYQQIYAKIIAGCSNLEKTAYDFGNQEIEQEHLLYNLLHQEDSLILKMIEKMEINKEHFLDNDWKMHRTPESKYPADSNISDST